MPEFEEQAGANVEEVAAPQEKVEVQDTGANEPGAADPKPVQTAETNAAFAEMRRKADDAERRASQFERDHGIARKYGTEYGVFSEKDIAERFASQGIRTVEQFEQVLERQQYEQAGLNPDLLNQFIDNHPDVKAARESKREQSLLQQDRKLETDPNVGELYKQYRDEVHQLAESANADYDIAFTLLLRDKLPTLLKGVTSKTEQETIIKLQQNADTSTGSLSAGGDITKPSVKDMSKDDFEAMILKAKRGEKVQF